MKKSLAFLLALCLTINMSGMVFAEEISPNIPETAVTEAQQEETTPETSTADADTAAPNAMLDSGILSEKNALKEVKFPTLKVSFEVFSVSKSEIVVKSTVMLSVLTSENTSIISEDHTEYAVTVIDDGNKGINGNWNTIKLDSPLSPGTYAISITPTEGWEIASPELTFTIAADTPADNNDPIIIVSAVPFMPQDNGVQFMLYGDPGSAIGPVKIPDSFDTLAKEDVTVTNTKTMTDYPFDSSRDFGGRGTYNFYWNQPLPAGTYKITVEKSGFRFTGTTAKPITFTVEGDAPDNNEKVRLVVQDVASDFMKIVVTSDTRAMDYEGDYTLSKDDISVIEVTATGANGKTYFPNDCYSHGGGYYNVFFDSPLPAGQYSLKIKDKLGFTVTEITNNPFTIKQKMSTPKITFAPPDTQGAVLVTLSVPEAQSNNVTIEYCVNDGEWKRGTAPVTFTISADSPDAYLTKEIVASAYHDDYEYSEQANVSYLFVPAADAFQVVVTPSRGLEGFITTKTLMATLSAKNAKGDVTYEIDTNKYYGGNGGFVIEGNKVYSEDDYQFDPTDYSLYVKATDNRNDTTMTNPVSYGRAVIHIAPEGSGGDQDDDSDSDDSDSGSSGGGSSGGGSSGNTSNSGSSSSTEKVYTVVDAEKDVDKAISVAFEKGIPVAEINLKNTTKLLFKAIEAIKQKVQLQGNPVTVIIRSDVIKGNAVESRLRFELSKMTLTTDLDLSVKLENQAVTNLFDKHFDNQTAVVSFAQAGTFGMPVEVAAMLDLTKLNTKALKFYTYDAKTNAYAEMTAPNPWIDANGYLHFTTTVGNNVVITDKPLTRK